MGTWSSLTCHRITRRSWPPLEDMRIQGLFKLLNVDCLFSLAFPLRLFTILLIIEHLRLIDRIQNIYILT